MTTKTSIVIGMFGLCGLLAGCASSAPAGDWPAYPPIGPRDGSGVARVGVADVQVFRDGPILSMTNTSPGTLGPGLLWINAAYSVGMDELPPGGTTTIDLRDCRNEFGQAFRGGGFFATQRPDDVVMAEVETDAGMTGLKVTTRPGV